MPPDSRGGFPWAVVLLAFALPSAVVVGEDLGDEACPAGGPSADVAGACRQKKLVEDDGQNLSCQERGFNPQLLTCDTCKALGLRIQEAGGLGVALSQECMECCQEKAEVERFSTARLLADAGAQERDQDLHDFIKRKAPMFPSLEVEYQEGAWPAIEFEDPEEPNRVVRADVTGWGSDHLVQFLSERLKKEEGSGEEGLVAQGVWTAEIQTCSGWRLNQLPEVRRFIKEPGHADTYVGLKVNFIPHHNPDLVFFNEHGEEKERLDLGRYNTEQIHRLMQDKGFKKKKARVYRGEIRTCSGWRLNQLPEVRKFILDRGNADAYVAMKLTFIPHHSPVLVLLDEKGGDKQQFALDSYSFQGLVDFMAKLGFVKKELL